MNTVIRARRILAALANYQSVGQVTDWPSESSNERLGEPIGRYRNPGPEGDVVGIFADGVAWFERGCSVELRFADIVEVTLPSGKESEGLLLRMHDGRQLLLPVKGQRGRFFDSMEMLRFLDRVIQDLRGQVQPAD
jgi:hypothetical protein